MRNFVWNSIKSSKCNASNQHYKSGISDDVFNFISQKLGVECNVCDILDKYFEYVYKYEKKLLRFTI